MRWTRGFTLIELVLTIVVISAGLFGLMVLFDAASRGTVQSLGQQAAVYLAQERLEIITADKASRGYDYVVMSNYVPTEVVTLGTGQYTRLLTIQEVSSADLTTITPNSGYKWVAVAVAWGSGAENQIMLTMVLGRY